MIWCICIQRHPVSLDTLSCNCSCALCIAVEIWGGLPVIMMTMMVVVDCTWHVDVGLRKTNDGVKVIGCASPLPRYDYYGYHDYYDYYHCYHYYYYYYYCCRQHGYVEGNIKIQ